MKRASAILTTVLVCGACGGGEAATYEDAIEEQASITEDMIEVLEKVTDEESARAAVSEIEALAQDLAALAKRMTELPQPSEEELQRITEKARERAKEFQEKATAQLMKLAQYPELMQAFTKAMERVQ
jgi:hypothetical protein